jgi:hypothetical protein
MTEPLDIPASAFEPKAKFFERPSREYVAAFKQFIADTGTPHLHPDHTHTKPPKGSRVTFLAKYGLPITHRRRERWAPCPCCSQWHPKYFRHGLIAWFLDEGVIRCVGDKCYKTMDPEGYALAMEQLNAEIEAERTAEFLLTRIPLIPDYIRVITNNLPVIEAIDAMLNQLRATLDKTFAIDLWPEVSRGLLRYVVMRNVVRRGLDGSEEVQTIPDYQDYGTIAGYSAVRPQNSRIASRLRMRINNLQTIDFGSETHSRIVSMTELEKKAAVKILSWAHGQANKLCNEAEEARQFFTPVTVGTVNGWAAQDGCPVRVHFITDDDGFHIARDPSQSHSRLPWPERFWGDLRQLEPLVRTRDTSS